MTKTSRLWIIFICTSCALRVGLAQNVPSSRVSPAEAKNHVGEIATVCGKVVETKLNKYGVAGHGIPVMLDLDQPEPNPVFYVVTFGSKESGPDEVIAAYKNKNICATGKITLASGKPYIILADRTNIKVSTAK
jgi:hypothetical protein